MSKITLQTVSSTDVPPSGSMAIYANDDGNFYAVDASGVERSMTKDTLGEDVYFYAGDNPPFLASVDTYGFEDAAGFPAGEDRDVIFKLGGLSALENGVTLTLIYALSAAGGDQVIRFKFDYIVHNRGEPFDGGTSHVQTSNITVSNAINTLYASQVFSIDAADVIGDTVEIECKITRMGSTPHDTFVGDVALKHILVATN